MSIADIRAIQADALRHAAELCRAQEGQWSNSGHYAEVIEAAAAALEKEKK